MELSYHDDIITWGKGTPKCSILDLEESAKWVFFPHEMVLPQKYTSQITKTEFFIQLPGKRRGKERVMSLSEPALGKYLFLGGKTVIPQENFHFKKKNFHWKIILMEKRLAMAPKDKTAGLSQGEVNAKASGLILPQSSCRIMGTTPPFSVKLILLQFFAHVHPPLFRAGTVSHCMLCTAYCNTCVGWLLALH